MAEEAPTLPHSAEAEKSVLGALLIDPDAIFRVADKLRENDFFFRRHQWIYEAIVGLNEKGMQADLLSVCDMLEKQGEDREQRLVEAGGAAYLTGMINATGSALMIEQYALIVIEKARRRAYIALAGKLAAAAYDETADLDGIDDMAQEGVFDASVARDGDWTPISDAVSVHYDHTDAAYRGERETRIPIFLKALQHAYKGRREGDLVIIASRPGMGKTSFLLQDLLYVAENHGPVGLFSLEMSAEENTNRLLSQMSGIDSQRLMDGELREEEWPAYVGATSALSKLPIFLDDRSTSLVELRARARKLVMREGVVLLYVDYLQLLSHDETSRMSRVEEMSKISRALKLLARQLGIPIMCASQLSRAVEQRADKHPMLSDLRESGTIEQDSDVVGFLYRDEYYNPDTEQPNIVEIIISKNRHGPAPAAAFAFWKRELTQFCEVEMYREPLNI